MTSLAAGTVVSTAAPRIGAALRVPASAVGLVITAYLITAAMLIPLSGWAVARFGARRVFLAAIVTFTAASLLCSASGSLGELVAWRVVQGAGGAMMVPVGRLVVLARPGFDLAAVIGQEEGRGQSGEISGSGGLGGIARAEGAGISAEPAAATDGNPGNLDERRRADLAALVRDGRVEVLHQRPCDISSTSALPTSPCIPKPLYVFAPQLPAPHIV